MESETKSSCYGVAVTTRTGRTARLQSRIREDTKANLAAFVADHGVSEAAAVDQLLREALAARGYHAEEQ